MQLLSLYVNLWLALTTEGQGRIQQSLELQINWESRQLADVIAVCVCNCLDVDQ